MRYIEENLLPDEKIIYGGHRHWIVFVFPIIWLILGLFFLIKGLSLPIQDIIPVSLLSIIDAEHIQKFIQLIAIIPLLLASTTGISALINYFLSEIAVTNVRILIKTGFIKRYSTEIPLRNIATILVTQTFWGRIFGYGTVKICDVGNVCLPFKRIVAPISFRSHVQAEINKLYPHGVRPQPQLQQPLQIEKEI